jgi:hypothetical protein
MKRTTINCVALSISAAALLAGCGGSQPPIGAPGAMAQTSALATHAKRGTSWMLPEAKSGPLLYLSVFKDSEAAVDVFTFPRGKLVGTLTGFASAYGLCSDNKGNVFVTDWYRQNITEYAHGGTTPIATLADPGYETTGCSFDPTTGNLAVVNAATSSGGAGNIAVYANEQGTPTFYSDAVIGYYWYCSYDNTGNLFVSGRKFLSGGQDFAELSHGSSDFQDLSIPFPVGGGMQWDGEYVAVASEVNGENAQIYRLSVSGSTVTVEGTVPISRGKHKVNLAGPIWIGDRRIAAPLQHSVAFWNYPTGGLPVKEKLYKTGRGVTVSYP